MPADDRWNTESRSAYVYYVADPTGAPPPPPSHPVSKAPRLKPRPSAEEWKEMASAPPAGDGDEWVLVDVVPQDGSSSPRKKKKVVLRKRRKAGKKSKQAKSLPVTRNMTDTKFAETFNKPIPHLYGRNNTNPATDDNYLRTHNVMERRPSQVYDSAKQAMDRPAYNPPKPPPRKHELKSDEDDYRICDKITQINHALVECDKPRGHDENMTFGDASKPRSEEPSMYEVLSWHDSSYTCRTRTTRRFAIPSRQSRKRSLCLSRRRKAGGTLQSQYTCTSLCPRSTRSWIRRIMGASLLGR